MAKIKKITSLVLFAILLSSFNSVSAATSVPEKLIYEARLLDATTNDPLNTNHTFRFSFWIASPVNVGDVVAGAIDPFALNYGGWQEVQTVTPNDLGFVSFELGTISALPEIDYTEHLYLQVEIKAAGDPDTAYEILDRDPTDPLSDRAAVGSVPYALNADMIDNAEIGTNDGDIVLLGPGGVFSTSVIPGGTNEDIFVLDDDNSSITNIELQFGDTLGKLLSFDIVGGYFNFNDDVNIEGDLTITGTVDGYDVSDLGDSVADLLDGEDRAIVLNSQFDGSSYVGDGTDNTGRLYLDNDNTALENYYEWTSSKGTLQDYDIVLQVTVPKTFVQWEAVNPWTFNYRSSSADPLITKADIFVYDTAGVLVTLVGTSTDLANTSWSQTALDYGGAPTFTPGESFIIVVRLHAKDDEAMNVGEIQLNYEG
ncbi:hypothetical protein ACFL3T_04755 [Patescibacteria group bacterium]